MSTLEYRFEFRIDDSGEWYTTPDVCYDEESAIKRFNELISESNMGWRLIKEEMVSTVIKTEKGKV